MVEARHLLGRDFFKNDLVQLAVIWRNPQSCFPLHNHDFSELVIVLEGHGIHFTAKSQRQLSSGDVFVIKGNEAHGYKDLDDLVLVNVLFNWEALEIPLLDLGKSTGFHALFTVEPVSHQSSGSKDMLRIPRNQLLEVLNLVRKIDIFLNDVRPGNHFVAVSWFMQLVQRLSDFYDRHYQNDKFRSPGKISAALSYIENHLDQNITIDQLIERVGGVSESTLLRMFKHITGFSPMNYIRTKKVLKAARLLKNSQLSITEIAFLTGFSDSNYFSRVFKKVMKKPPQDYRSQ